MFKKNKYRNIQTTYNGRTYHSGLEARVAERIDWMIQAGELTKVTPQYKIELIVNDILIAKHYVDFLVEYPNGKQEFWEAKGFDKPEWLLKKNLTIALYPTIKYIVIRK